METVTFTDKCVRIIVAFNLQQPYFLFAATFYLLICSNFFIFYFAATIFFNLQQLYFAATLSFNLQQLYFAATLI